MRTSFQPQHYHGRSIGTVELDVTDIDQDQDQVKQVIDGIIEALGRLGLLVDNAGIDSAKHWELDVDEWTPIEKCGELAKNRSL